MTDLDYYAWRVPTTDDDGPRLLVPMGNPAIHEAPFDLLFNTEAEARAALDEWDVADDAAEENWVLVHYVGTVVT